MAKKSLKDADLDSIINAGSFNTKEPTALADADPIAPTAIKINLDEIEPFDKNPRRAANKSREAIKDTIIQQGIDALSFPVTRRPGQSHYIPNSGGNTRLDIMNELYKQTQDEKYYWINTTFIPYVDETTLLINHLGENDNRDSNIFIDNALGIRETYEQYLKDHPDVDEISQRDFINFLKEAGLGCTREALRAQNYAIDELYAYIPQALDSGTGRPRVVSLKKIETIFGNYWQAQSLPNDEFKAHWRTVLSQNDSWDSFCVNQIESDILDIVAERVITQHIDFPGLLTREAIQGEAEKLHSRPDAQIATLSEEPNYGWPTDDEDSIDSNSDHSNAAPSYTNLAGPTLSDLVDKEQVEPSKADEQDDAKMPGIRPHQQSSNDLASFRNKCYALSLDIATETSLSAFIKPLDSGFGFYIDVPGEYLADEMASYWWWKLFLIAAIHTFDNFEKLPESSQFRNIVTITRSQNPAIDNEDVLKDVFTQIRSSIGEFICSYENMLQMPYIFESEFISTSLFDKYLSLLATRRTISEKFSMGELWDI